MTVLSTAEREAMERVFGSDLTVGERAMWLHARDFYGPERVAELEAERDEQAEFVAQLRYGIRGAEFVAERREHVLREALPTADELQLLGDLHTFLVEYEGPGCGDVRCPAAPRIRSALQALIARVALAVSPEASESTEEPISSLHDALATLSLILLSASKDPVRAERDRIRLLRFFSAVRDAATTLEKASRPEQSEGEC